MKGYLLALVDPEFRLGAIKVALVVGSLLFTINHGPALMQQDMTISRWLAGTFTYVVPYCVNVHGQYASRLRRKHCPISIEAPSEELPLGSGRQNR
ncbi:nitrate/nitrite transporter NrtS [Pseudanabaena sp. FACHB-2040]|uniref:nitrate/nitrite transporter NrtS n=1 Tax=Pseudanabaena sp. FACHB-2040 TaxID=2692859 RepID=UPI001685E164|nr:nitrate/nitrite transporter NrtS [Pseudanabaena sp. FACHB-2040]MBD2257006.1 nitrate/nitrite transporter NrtS [Pseudanabaena sp. FACHB-2040]